MFPDVLLMNSPIDPAAWKRSIGAGNLLTSCRSMSCQQSSRRRTSLNLENARKLASFPSVKRPVLLSSHPFPPDHKVGGKWTVRRERKTFAQDSDYVARTCFLSWRRSTGGSVAGPLVTASQDLLRRASTFGQRLIPDQTYARHQ